MLLAFSIAPLGAGESVTDAVADAVAIVRESGLPYRLDAMFTTVEGDWDEVFDLVRRASDTLTARGHRVSLVMKADIRPGRTGELTGKVSRVETELDRRGGEH
ncbi:MTH1187 family thiamine-binding protein [Ruania zhangjianzhongii]|uniref:MTH1187 family thiamine-binding protein n=1 Tax=Ruania zhangjianzhongii TaxID=2603206 RepID=UPI0011C9CA10|nr:MTH1187 family thiamine-binding protein [Ruania zhangjianzhongii]